MVGDQTVAGAQNARIAASANFLHPVAARCSFAAVFVTEAPVATGQAR